MKKRLACLVLTALLALGAVPPVLAASSTAVDTALSKAQTYVAEAVPSPAVGSIGGEWAVLGLARSSAAVPANYYQGYYTRVEALVKSKKGVLSTSKTTDYARLTVALTAIGMDPRAVAGYNLIAPLLNFETVVRQGINGPIWALIAMDCGNPPSHSVTVARQKYVSYLLDHQLSDGGWSLTSKGSADTDLTAMALQALAKYTDDPKVAASVKKGVDCLGKSRGSGYQTCETAAQVVVALTELGISLEDSRFTSKGRGPVDDLLSYQLSSGGFAHTSGGAVNQMASEQALYALTAANRANHQQATLYQMK